MRPERRRIACCAVSARPSCWVRRPCRPTPDRFRRRRISWQKTPGIPVRPGALVHHGRVDRELVEHRESPWSSADAIRAVVAAEIVQETVQECERLLLDAEATAERMRAAAEEDSARVRRDAVRSNTRLLTELEQRRPQVEASLVAARAVAARAMEMSTGLMDAQRRAQEVLDTAVAQAKEMADQVEERLAAAVLHHAAAEAALRRADDRDRTAGERFAQADAQHADALQRAGEAVEVRAAATARMEEADRLLAVATQVLGAAEASRQLVDTRGRAVGERGAEVERRFADLRAATKVALAEVSAAATAAVEAAAAQRFDAEADAQRIGERAWHAAQVLQRELLEEADAEALEITLAASVDAAQIRKDAEDEARAIHLEARVRADAEAQTVAARLLATPVVPAPAVVPREGWRPTVVVPAVALAPDRETFPMIRPALAEPERAPELQPQPAAETATDPEPARSGYRRQILAVLLLIGVAAVLVRLVVATPYSVESESMEPTLLDGQEVVVNKLAYSVGDPERGDVVVLNLASEAFVKRIVGLPGEVIEGRDGLVLVDGEALAETYLDGAVTSTFAPVELGPDQLFVLGDNREASADSRSFGPVNASEVVGRAELVLWPLADIGRL